MFNYSSIDHLVVSILDTDAMNGQTTFYLDLLNNLNFKERAGNLHFQTILEKTSSHDFEKYLLECVGIRRSNKLCYIFSVI